MTIEARIVEAHGGTVDGERADVTAQSNGGYTPLHFAASAGDEAVAELLLADHADVNATDDKGETPLRVGLASDKDLMELLSQHGGHN